MVTILEWYDMILWHKNGELYVSHSYPETIAKLSKNGYGFICELGDLKYKLSELLDETDVINLLRVKEVKP